MRLLATVLLMSAFALAAQAQTRTELESKFGRFDGRGYAVTPEVRLTVTFGDDGLACNMELRSAKTPPLRKDGQHETFAAELADRVLHEIAPSRVRKGKPLQMIDQMSCAAVASEEYENIAIVRETNECLPTKSNVEGLVIHWKRPACGSVVR